MTPNLPHSADTSLSTPVRLCCFRLGTDWFGIDVLHVQELLQLVPLTGVPLAPEVVVGLINVRGVIVTAISPKHRLGFHDKAYDVDHRMITVHSGDLQVAMLVDEVGDVILIDPKKMTPPPPSLINSLAGLAIGIYSMDGCLITCLDLPALVSP